MLFLILKPSLKGKVLKLLKIEEVADILSVSIPTIRLWMKEKKIRYIKLGTKNCTLRFDSRDVEKMINRFKVEDEK